MSAALFEESLLVVSPGLAATIGLSEAIVIQQMHYWLKKSKIEKGGRRWIYNTYQEWSEQFPFWKPETIRKIVSKLREVGLVDVQQLSDNPWDKTNFYSINYEVLRGKGVRIEAENHTASDAENHTASKRKPGSHVIQETTQETTAETTRDISASRLDEAFDLYWSASKKCGSRKKAASLFASICKRDKRDPMEFSAMLVADTKARLAAKQFGFEKMHGTTYLNQERWNDSMPLPVASAVPCRPGRPSLITQDFTTKTYESTPDDQLADFLQ